MTIITDEDEDMRNKDENLKMPQKHLLVRDDEENKIKRGKLRPYFSDLNEDQLMTIFGEGLRFEMCSCFLTYEMFDRLKLFGTIQVAPDFSPDIPDPLLQNVSFDVFNREFNNSIRIPCHGDRELNDLNYISLSVSSTSVLQIAAKLYLTSDKVDDMENLSDDYDPEPPAKLEPKISEDEAMKKIWANFKVIPERLGSKLEAACTLQTTTKVERFIDNEALHVCDDRGFIDLSDKPNGGSGSYKFQGKHGSLELYYVAVKYAVDADLEVEFFQTSKDTKANVEGNLLAYYGKGFDNYDNPDFYYDVVIFETTSPAFVTPGKINLIRSVLAVPAKSSLIISANLRGLSGTCEFRVPCDCRSSVGTIKGNGCSLKLKVNWKLPSYEELKIRSSSNSSVSRHVTERRTFGAHSTPTSPSVGLGSVCVYSTPTMADPDERNRWSLQEEIAKVFNTSLKQTFKIKEAVPCSISTCTKEDSDDYLCSSVLHIWPEIKNDRLYKGPKRAGLAVKDSIMGSDYKDMMERCVVCGPGFVKFKLCRKWMAKSIHRMLMVGIETWAPKLYVKKAIIYFMSQNIAEEMNIGHLRSTFIGETLARMLEFSGAVVLRKIIHDGDFMNEKIKERYQTVYQRLGINVKEEDNSLYESYARNILDLFREKGLPIGSEGDELPLVDLTVLWHALKEEKADWIVHVTDVGKREYTEMCIAAAKHVGLIASDHSKCPLSHVGFGLAEGDDIERFRTFSTKMVNLVDLVDKAKSCCKALLVRRGIPSIFILAFNLFRF